MRQIVKDTVAEFYDKLYQNRHEMQLIPSKEEIIDRKELSKRLNITKPIILHWEKRKKIPAIRMVPPFDIIGGKKPIKEVLTLFTSVSVLPVNVPSITPCNCRSG